jgi:glutathione S-transferase
LDLTDLFRPAKGVSTDYLKINKLGKVPTFVGADGYTLHECVAIAIYSEWKIYIASLLPSQTAQTLYNPLL